MVASYKCVPTREPGRVVARGRRRADPALGRLLLFSTPSLSISHELVLLGVLYPFLAWDLSWICSSSSWLPWPSFYRERRRPRATKGSGGVFVGKKPLPRRVMEMWLLLLHACPCVSLSTFRKGGGSGLTPPPTKTEAMSFFLEPKSSGT